MVLRTFEYSSNTKQWACKLPLDLIRRLATKYHRRWVQSSHQRIEGWKLVVCRNVFWSAFDRLMEKKSKARKCVESESNPRSPPPPSILLNSTPPFSNLRALVFTAKDWAHIYSKLMAFQSESEVSRSSEYYEKRKSHLWHWLNQSLAWS